MANPTVEKIARTNADALAQSGQVAETIMKAPPVQELTKEYQELATKNAKNLTTAI